MSFRQDVKPSLFPSHLSKVELRKLRASVNVGDPGCRGVKDAVKEKRKIL